MLKVAVVGLGWWGRIITGLLKADAGVVWVNGQRVDQLTEREMMAVRPKG